MTALELVEKYKIYIVHEQWNKTTGRYEKVENVIGVANIGTAKRDGMIEELKARKAEIIEAIKNKKAEEKKARDERQAKIDAIEGLAEILAAESRLIEWNLKFDKIIANGESAAFLSSKPSYNFEEALKKYPRAAAYLKAEKLAKNKDEKLAEVGKKALEEIISGDWRKASEEMDSEKKAYDAANEEKNRVFILSSKEDVETLEKRCDRERELVEIRNKNNSKTEKRVSFDDFLKLLNAGELKEKNAVLVNVNNFGPYYTVKNFLEVQNILNSPNTQGEKE